MVEEESEVKLPVLVIAGKGGAGRRTLVSRIPGSRKHPLPSVVETLEPGVWSIETKYFNVDVRVRCAEVPQDVILDGAPCEGIILMFDVTDEGSFKHLECWEPFLEEHSLEVAICAGNKTDADGIDMDHNRERWTNWSLDHQLEFCECSALADVFTGNRDTEGVERIVEALGSHTWSGFIKKTPGNQGATPPHGAKKNPKSEEAGDKAGTHAFDTSKWDEYVAAQHDEEAEELARQELGKIRLERACYDGEIHIDDEVQQLVEHAQLTDAEVGAIAELLEATQVPDLYPDKFFRDPAALATYHPGANAALHINLDLILPGVSRALQLLIQIYRENPAAQGLLVRNAIWSNMVDAAERAEEEQGERAAGVPVLVPLALVWSVLESCAAETAGKLWARVSRSKQSLSDFLETAMAPAIVRCLHAGVCRSDYIQQLLEAARSEKEAGNLNFKNANLYAANIHYRAALSILEQFFVRGSMCLEGARELALACHLNTAACLLKDTAAGAAEDAAMQCNMALALAPDCAKAYYRRGLAMLASQACDTDTPPRPPEVAPARAPSEAHRGGGRAKQMTAEEVRAAANELLAAKRQRGELPPKTKTQREETQASEEEEAAQRNQANKLAAAHLPPRRVLVTWALRDLERANELEPCDAAVTAVLRAAKKEAAALAQKEASTFSRQKEASGARVERVVEVGEEEEEAGAADSQDDVLFAYAVETHEIFRLKQDVGQLMSMMKMAREEALLLPDDERRSKAAAMAAKAAAFLGVADDDEDDAHH